MGRRATPWATVYAHQDIYQDATIPALGRCLNAIPRCAGLLKRLYPHRQKHPMVGDCYDVIQADLGDFDAMKTAFMAAHHEAALLIEPSRFSHPLDANGNGVIELNEADVNRNGVLDGEEAEAVLLRPAAYAESRPRRTR